MNVICFLLNFFYYITTIFKIMHKAYIIHNCTVLVYSTKNLILKIQFEMTTSPESCHL